MKVASTAGDELEAALVLAGAAASVESAEALVAAAAVASDESDVGEGAAAAADELAPARTAEASAGEIVLVLVETTACPDGEFRVSPLRSSGEVSMNAMVGPAISCVVARSLTLPSRGCASEVM